MKNIELKDISRNVFNRIKKIKVPFQVVGVFCALFIGGILIAFSGTNPFHAYSVMIEGAVGSRYQFFATLTRAVPLIMTGLAVSVAFRSKLFNIGVEGQFIVGGMAAFLISYYAPFSGFLLIAMSILGSIAVGAIWAFIPAILKVKRGVSVVITTIMLNYIAIIFTSYLVNVHFHCGGSAPATKQIPFDRMIPLMIQQPTKLSYSFLIAIVVAILIYILVTKSVLGYKIRAVGFNQEASKYAGINIGVMSLLSMLISGALAGLGGGLEISGSLGRFYSDYSPKYGFDGIPIALLAKNNAIAVIFSALFFSALRTGGTYMQALAGVPSSIIYIIQGIIILFIASEHLFKWAFQKMVRKVEV